MQINNLEFESFYHIRQTKICLQVIRRNSKLFRTSGVIDVKHTRRMYSLVFLKNLIIKLLESNTFFKKLNLKNDGLLNVLKKN